MKKAEAKNEAGTTPEKDYNCRFCRNHGRVILKKLDTKCLYEKCVCEDCRTLRENNLKKAMEKKNKRNVDQVNQAMANASIVEESK